MPSNQEIIYQTHMVRSTGEALENAICQAEGFGVSDALQLAVDSIPFQIAAAEALGARTASLFALVEGEHFVVPPDVDPYKSERPESEWLIGDAAIAFRYCEEAGLLPSLAPYNQPLDSSLKSELLIDLAGTAVANCEAVRCERGVFRTTALSTPLVCIPYPEREAVRKRVARVLAAAPQILHNARRASAEHQHKAVLLRLEDSQLSENPLELESDFKLFCQHACIPAVCKTISTPVGDGFERQFTVMYQLR